MSVAAAVVAAARASGGTKGLQVGTLSSSRLCAKKQICRLHLVPSLHSCVRYLHQQLMSLRHITVARYMTGCLERFGNGAVARYSI